MSHVDNLTVRRRLLDADDYLSAYAREGDVSRLITEPTRVYDAESGALVLAYLRVENDLTPLHEALQRVKISRHKRTGGMITTSEIVGYFPRNRRHNDYCSAASIARRQPAVHARIVSYAPLVERAYAEANPTLYDLHRQAIEDGKSRILPEWRMEGTVFTSGIVNRDNRLAYHRDTGNLPNVWSAMLGFRREMAGGYLAIPEYDLAVAVGENSLTLFDGQQLFHGVTPLVPTGPQADRHTLVFYTLRLMCHCLPFAEELERIQRKRTERERKRYARPDGA